MQRRAGRVLAHLSWSLLLSSLVAAPSFAQSGSVRGTVMAGGTDDPLEAVVVEIPGTRFTTRTGSDGAYALTGIAPGTYTIRFSRPGHEPIERSLAIGEASAVELDVRWDGGPLPLSAAPVGSATISTERAMDTPAAVTALEPGRVSDRASAGQAGLLLADLPGVAVAQGGFDQFVVGPRSLMDLAGRRVLVRVDGRDLGANLDSRPEWAALALAEPGTRLELIRGPSSAIYGANAFGGVVDIRTPPIREARGSRVSLGLGELESRYLRARWAGVTEDLRWGLSVAGGWASTRGHDASRTGAADLEREYASATDSAVIAPLPGFERVALNGQRRTTPDSVPGPVLGDPDPQTTVNGTVRLERYLDDGGVLTAEAGITRIENQVTTTDASRRQIERADVPWARLEIDRESYRVNAYYAGRTGSSTDLSAGASLEERSSRLHIEGRVDRAFRDGGVRVRVGASARQDFVDSEGTLLSPISDGRTDRFLAAFGQLEWDLRPDVELSAAARLDESSIWDTRFTPQLAVVWHATDDHALRLTFEHGFQTPTAEESFARVQLAPPVDLLDVEAVIRGSVLGPSMGAVPDGELFTNSTAVPLLGIGNPELEPEEVSALRLGYTGQVGGAFLTADVHYSEFDAFRSDLLPGVHPDFGRWSAPAAIPGEFGLLVGAFALDLVPGLTRLENGQTAIVLSRTNAGSATQWGADVSVGVRVTDQVRIDGGYSWVAMDIDEGEFVGAARAANTPDHVVNLSASWTEAGGRRARVSLRSVSGMDFRDGVFAGWVPARQSLDLDLRGPLGPTFDVALSLINAVDQQRFHHFGGAVIGRRLVASVVWSP